MDFLAAQRFIESFIRIPGEHYPTVEQVQDDPWTSAEWLLSSQMASCDRDYVTSTATFLTHLTSPGPVGMSSCECAMATEVLDFSPQFGGRNLREPGLCGSPSESCIGSLTPSRDPCRCKSLGATYSAALNRLQEAYLTGTNRSTTALRLAAPRAFWLWYTRHTDHGAGIFGYFRRWADYYFPECFGRMGWWVPLATFHFRVGGATTNGGALGDIPKGDGHADGSGKIGDGCDANEQKQQGTSSDAGDKSNPGGHSARVVGGVDEDGKDAGGGGPCPLGSGPSEVQHHQAQHSGQEVPKQVPCQPLGERVLEDGLYLQGNSRLGCRKVDDVCMPRNCRRGLLVVALALNTSINFVNLPSNLKEVFHGFQRMLRKTPDFYVGWRSFMGNFSGRLFPGPFSKLLELAELLGWTITTPPCFSDHDGCIHDLLEIGSDYLDELLYDGWLQNVARQIGARTSMQGLQGL